MPGSVVLPVLLWIALWVLVGAGFVLLVRRGRDYIAAPGTTSLYFGVASVVAGAAFGEWLGPALHGVRAIHLGWFGALLCLQFAAHLVAHRKGNPRDELVRRAPHVYWLRMDWRYLVSKTFEIAFQQTMLVSLVLLLAAHGLSAAQITAIAVPVFGIVHLPIARLVGRFFGFYYLASALVAAAIMPAVVLWKSDGWVYSFTLHFLYYLGSQLAFWQWGRSEPGPERPRST